MQICPFEMLAAHHFEGFAEPGDDEYVELAFACKAESTYHAAQIAMTEFDRSGRMMQTADWNMVAP
jgi:hypothetical protein